MEDEPLDEIMQTQRIWGYISKKEELDSNRAKQQGGTK